MFQQTASTVQSFFSAFTSARRDPLPQNEPEQQSEWQTLMLVLTDLNETIGLKIDIQELIVEKLLADKSFKSLKSLLQDDSSNTDQIVAQCINYFKSLTSDQYADS